MHIIDGRIEPTRTMTITEHAAKGLSDFRMKAGEIVIGRRGDMGRCAVVQQHQAGWLCGTGSMIVRPQNADAGFLQRVLSSPQAISAIEDASVGTTMVNLNQGTLAGLTVQLPPLPEQRAIATALSDVDALLGGLDRLIAKKRDLKQAAMQQLLTGQTRLPGFHAAWDTPRLAELFSFKNGLNKAKGFFGYGTPIVNYMDVYGKRGLCANDLQGRVSLTREELRAFDVRKGDVFFTRTSETADEVGITSVMLEEPQNTVFSGFVLRARPKDDSLEDQFKKYCFSTLEVRRQITSQSTETTRALTNGRYLSGVTIARPTKTEQTAIAAVLSDMDAELAALEQRRDKTGDLKQAMMQELLTGKTRLAPAGGAHA
jgi:type I restriction enzyme S subunit